MRIRPLVTVPIVTLLLSVLSCSQSPALELDRYGGCTAIKGHNTSGFFRLEKIGNRYWLVTPDNNVFWSVGTLWARYGYLPISNSQGIYSCPTIGYAPSILTNLCKYGDEAAWVKAAAQRFGKWGMNTASCDAQPLPGIVDFTHNTYVTMNAHWGQGCPWVNGRFCDVFDERFAKGCDAASANIARFANDPWVLGYWPDNEIYWNAYAANGQSLVDCFIKLPATAAGKKAWVDWLKGRYAEIAKLNEAWGTDFAAWTGEGKTLENCTELKDDAAHPAILADKIAFMGEIADKYYSTATAAIRKYDKNHLIFSDRLALFSGQHEANVYTRPFMEEVWKAAGKYCDIYSINCYADLQDMEKIHKLWSTVYARSGKPIFISEHDTQVRDTIFPSRPYMVDTQMDRAHEWEKHATDALNMQASPTDPTRICLGSQWYCWEDESNWGPGEYNKDAIGWEGGIVNGKDEAYVPFADVFRRVNEQVYRQACEGKPIALLPAPQVLSPAQTRITGTALPTFTWSPVAGATSYTLLYSPEACFPDAQTIRIDRIHGTSYTPAVPLAQGKWQWTVRAEDESGGGHYAKTAPFTIGNLPAYQVDPGLSLRCEQVTGWAVTDAPSAGGWGTVWVFRDEANAAEGKSSARLVFTVNSRSKATGAKNPANTSITCKLACGTIDCPRSAGLSFQLYPHRFADTDGSIVSPSRHLHVRLVGTDGRVVLDKPVDPNAELPKDAWSRVRISIEGTKQAQVSQVIFYINCGDNKLTWDERMVFSIDDIKL